MRLFIEKLAVLVVAAGLVVLFATNGIFSAAPPVIAGQIAAIVLIGWSRASFPTGAFAAGAAPRGSSLITTGPYSVLRHPIYSAAILFIWSTVLGHWSAVNAAVALVVTVTIMARIPAEERLLRDKFPEYDGYIRRTKRIVPFVW
jgi:protein-S-isoprenylcysteine O-methyltransferase Ste14